MAVQVKIFGQPIGGVKRARGTLDALVEEQQADAELAGAMGDLWAGASQRMTRQQLEGYTNALRQRASDVKTINAGHEGFQLQQERLRSKAATFEDRAQLETLDSQGAYAHELMLSNNPELQAMGRQLTAAVLSNQQAFATTNEAQKIAAETTVGAERWQRFTSSYDDLYRESSAFLETQRGHNTLREVYSGEGEIGNVQDVAAVNALQKMIDPGAIVREGDVALLANMSGVPDWLVTAANRVMKNGGRFSPEERRGLVELGDRLMAAANKQQAATNSRFQGIGAAAELTPQLIEKLALPLSDTQAGFDGMNFGAPLAAPAVDDEGPPAANLPREAPKGAVSTAIDEAFSGLAGMLDRLPKRQQRETDEYQGAPPPIDPSARRPKLPNTERGVWVPQPLRNLVRGGAR